MIGAIIILSGYITECRGKRIEDKTRDITYTELMTSDKPDALSILANLTGYPRDRFEYMDKIRDRSGREPTPIVDWEQEGAWDDLDASELEDDPDDAD